MDSRVGEDGANAIYALGDLATIQMTPPGHRSYISSTRTTRIIWPASRRSIAAS